MNNRENSEDIKNRIARKQNKRKDLEAFTKEFFEFGWGLVEEEIERKIESILTKMENDEKAKFEFASGQLNSLYYIKTFPNKIMDLLERSIDADIVKLERVVQKEEFFYEP